MTAIVFSVTERGFVRGDFVDRNGIECSIQESSAADEACIWLGCNDAAPRVCIPGGDPAWRLLSIPEFLLGLEIVYNTRMHLTRAQVEALLPVLQKFFDSGKLQ